MPSTKEIKGRIKSVKNTGKITRAMELISTVKMKKAQDNVLASRPFALESLRLLAVIEDSLKDIDLISGISDDSKKKELVVLISSNKGLCGGYNVNTFKRMSQYKKENFDTEFDYISIGKRARDFVVKTGGNLVGDYSENMKDSIDLYGSKKISQTLVNLYKTKEYTNILVIYNYYISAINQKAVIKQFLPINKDNIISYLESIIGEKTKNLKIEKENKPYKFEPSKKIIAEEIIPMILDMMFFEVLLEAKASEHAARMVAMKSAKDSANKKVTLLTLTYNKARQASITKEVSEIVSGVESMKDM